MSQHSCLLSLPLEILLHIFFLAQNPLLSHVCRYLWLQLPSFESFSKEVARTALTAGFDRDLRTFTTFVRDRPLSWALLRDEIRCKLSEDEILAQNFVYTQWLTVAQLSTLKSQCIRAGAESVFKAVGSPLSKDETASLEKFFYDQARGPRPSWNRALRLEAGNLELMVTRHDLQLVSNPSRLKLCVLRPFKSLPCIPQGLFRLVANFDRRALKLVDEMAQRTIHGCQPAGSRPELDDENSYGPNKREQLSTCICQLLDSVKGSDDKTSGKALDELAEECFLLLIKLNNILTEEQYTFYNWRYYGQIHQTVPVFQCHQWRDEEVPPHIKLKYYEHVIRDRNVPGLKLLLQINWTVFMPSVARLRIAIHQSLKQHLTEIGQISRGATLNALFKKANALGEPVWEEMWGNITAAREKAVQYEYDRRVEWARSAFK